MAHWNKLLEKVLPYVIKVETQEGHGTGFLFAVNATRTFVAFATSAHVVAHADNWKLPIRLRHHVSGKEIFVEEKDRIIEIDHERDSASILIGNPGDFLPTDVLPMVDSKEFVLIGTEIAWAGYPGIAPPHLCLFTGTVAAFDHRDDSYLIDGVAINGVSGGPVFFAPQAGSPTLIGSVSAYMSNRQRGESLPGLLRAQDVTPFQETVKKIHSIDEARAKAASQAQEERRLEASGEQAAPDAQDDTISSESPDAEA